MAGCCECDQVKGVFVCDGDGNCTVLGVPTGGSTWGLVWINGTGFDWINIPEADPSPTGRKKPAKPKTKPKTRK